MAGESSFDVVSKVDRQEVDNALNQAAKEVRQRFDFKNTDASIRWSGEAIEMAVEDFPHLALWTRPTAPFLSLEAWTGHADWAGFSGELRERNTIRLLAPGSSARHAVTLSWREA